MGFLDNLENSLNSLERADERDTSIHERRQNERAEALAIAPWAEKLKASDFTKRLFEEAAALGHRTRTKIYMAWLDSSLKLEAKGKHLVLAPKPDGVFASFEAADGSVVNRPVDLTGDPKQLLESWLL